MSASSEQCRTLVLVGLAWCFGGCGEDEGGAGSMADRLALSTGPASTAQTANWREPGIVAGAEAGSFALRDGRVSASLTREGAVITGAGGAEGAWQLRWTPVGARGLAPRPEDELPGKVNHLTGDPSGWRTGLPHYGRLVYPDVVPGIALTVESRRHALAYRFDLSAGADPRAIRLRYAGAEDVVVEDHGRALRVRTGGGSLRETGLSCFQEDQGARRDVPCRYAVLARDDGAVEVGFDVGPFDRERSLVVDPVIGWSSYLGGSFGDTAHG